MKKYVQKMWNLGKRISLVDGFLLVFLVTLFSYTCCSLFLFPSDLGSNSVDIIVRTSAAAIFGYFLSYHSLQLSPSGSETGGSSPSSTLSSEKSPPSSAHAQIGFSLASSSEDPVPGGASSLQNQANSSHAGFQIVIVSCIGLFSLALLFVIREEIANSTSVAATASQLRDFVSASVGFLVSCGKNMRKN